LTSFEEVDSKHAGPVFVTPPCSAGGHFVHHQQKYQQFAELSASGGALNSTHSLTHCVIVFYSFAFLQHNNITQ